jgi:hypothetical protein
MKPKHQTISQKKTRSASIHQEMAHEHQLNQKEEEKSGMAAHERFGRFSNNKVIFHDSASKLAKSYFCLRKSEKRKKLMYPNHFYLFLLISTCIYL